MSQVYRWPLGIHDEPQTIGGGSVALVGLGPEGHLNVWTIESAGSTRQVRIFGTGHPLPIGAVHLGSAVMDPFVWHVFDVTKCADRE